MNAMPIGLNDFKVKTDAKGLPQVGQDGGINRVQPGSKMGGGKGAKAAYKVPTPTRDPRVSEGGGMMWIVVLAILGGVGYHFKKVIKRMMFRRNQGIRIDGRADKDDNRPMGLGMGLMQSQPNHGLTKRN